MAVFVGASGAPVAAFGGDAGAWSLAAPSDGVAAVFGVMSMAVSVGAGGSLLAEGPAASFCVIQVAFLG